MMTSKAIRQQFLDFFERKAHEIVPSAPLVNKDDPTLLFTNAGMNQFKDYFLGNKPPAYPRAADTQKCLRVSGKHNDLEEVGLDSYHHTMFEMLGNWSFGDYFKAEAIAWAWELLTEVYKLDKDLLYVTVFEGDESDNLGPDTEAVELWKQFLPKDRILYFDRKDNFWEMGDTGPCGPCSEIHVDLRDADDRAATDARTLVNADHPQVVEIWNLVFIQYDRMANGQLNPLPAKHIDTGMGFERLVMALQGKKSNYETDVFSPFIERIEKASGITYTNSYATDAKTDIAMRVVADHLRAVSFAIADGAIPSNTGAGYVIRRILRRAVRYYYSFLGIQEPYMHTLLPLLVESFGEVFPNLAAQEDFVRKVVEQEEANFLRTLESGLKRLDRMEPKDGVISGADAFELYDTFGFPIDLTRLIASEKGWQIDEPAFEVALQEQRKRSRNDAARQVGDWMVLSDQTGTDFRGYDELTLDEVHVTRYRTVETKKGEQYQVVLDRTPFYAEGGGQVGDTGLFYFGEERVPVIDTQRENDLIIHILKKLPEQIDAPVRAEVNAPRRHQIEHSHSATHLLHAALREVLGDHVQQRGSLVKDDYLRFDFSHFSKMTDEELQQVERRVNEQIRANIALREDRNLPIEQAQEAGAMMLFGEKYGDTVRMVTFDSDYSVELCGGCHVPATGRIGFLKITNESAIAAGVRRLEAVTGARAEQYVQRELDELTAVRSLFKNQKDLAGAVEKLLAQNKQLQKQLDEAQQAQAADLKGDLMKQAEQRDGYQLLTAHLPLDDSKAAKTLAFELEKAMAPVVICLGLVAKGKPQLMLYISKELVEGKGFHAGNTIRQLAQHIKGGGGGQPFFASAGGKDAEGIPAALEAAKDIF